MFGRFDHRLIHYGVLLLTTALLTLPNLGKHSLWDVDEGVNAEAAREMLESGNWITPTFNYELRTAKPALLYWVQAASYTFLGVNEFAARLPSVLAAMLTVLLTYELARRMFGASTGLLAGLVLASAIEFCLLAHAATPDATLLFFTSLTFYFFWLAVEGNRPWWYVAAGAAAGFAVLTKGPVGIALPGLVAVSYCVWDRRLGSLCDRRVLAGIGAFLIVALPWYILVATETRGVWAAQFFGRENLTRFLAPMEDHRGPVFYHAIALLVLFSPWSVFLGGALWYGFRSCRRRAMAEAREPVHAQQRPPVETRAYRFLVCWFLAYLIFFSVAATKLPNYVLPLYPALAILTARFLDTWRLGLTHLPRWVMPTAFAALGVIGVIAVAGLLIAGGAFGVPAGKFRVLPGLATWAPLGVVPIGGAVAAIYFLARSARSQCVATCAVASVVFVAGIAAFPTVRLDDHKAPRELVEQAGACQPKREVRIGALQYFEPSLVFYGRREVQKFTTWGEAADFLSLPYPVYLFVPESVWHDVARVLPIPHREVGRRYDFLKNCDVLVVTNQ
jgi:4-amino-4-deoxy-L-arabinose transferase-like glycosyltransferase